MRMILTKRPKSQSLTGHFLLRLEAPKKINSFMKVTEIEVAPYIKQNPLTFKNRM